MIKCNNKFDELMQMVMNQKDAGSSSFDIRNSQKTGKRKAEKVAATSKQVINDDELLCVWQLKFFHLQKRKLQTDVYRVERILAHRKEGKVTQYLIKWENYEDSQNSWEPASNVSHDLIQEYENQI